MHHYFIAALLDQVHGINFLVCNADISSSYSIVLDSPFTNLFMFLSKFKAYRLAVHHVNVKAS